MTANYPSATAETVETTGSRLPLVAAQLFREKGYAATSIRDIADALGITKASLYYYVGGKQDLLHGLSLKALHHIRESVETALTETPDPRERLRCAIRAHIEAMLSERDLHATMLTEMRHLQGERLHEVLALRDAYEHRLRYLVQEAQSAGWVRRDWSAKLLTLALLNLLNWTIFWWKPEGQLSSGEVHRMLSDVFLHGAEAPHSPGGPELE